MPDKPIDDATTEAANADPSQEVLVRYSLKSDQEHSSNLPDAETLGFSRSTPV